MTFWSMMMVKVHDGQATGAAQAWVKRRCIEEAAESIPGFRHGEVLLSKDEPDRMCVLCVWEGKADYEAWLKSPLRDKQVADLAPVVSADVNTLCFESVHSVPKPK